MEDASGSAPGPELGPGTKIGEYVVERVIGRGGMGVVHAAVHPVIGKRVAIKVLRGDLARDATIVRRFVDEARAVIKIGHPNIVDIFGFGALDDGRQYFVMEYLEGGTLAQALAERERRPDDQLARGESDGPALARLLAQACDALSAAHAVGIVHRDLKPENLWIARPRHGAEQLKLLDFGIAKLLEAEAPSVTQSGLVIGTPQFMAPEQCLGEPVDHRADLYAMGVILYRVFTGRMPFAGRSFPEIVAHMFTVPPVRPSTLRPMTPALEALILACLARDPAARPHSAAELGARLLAAVERATPDTGGETVAAARPGAVPTAPRRGRLVFVLFGAAALLVAAVALLAGRHPRPIATPQPAPTPVARPARPDAAVVAAPDATREIAAPVAPKPRPRGTVELGRKNPYQ